MSKIFVSLRNINEVSAIVTYINYDSEKLTDEDKKDGIEVDFIPNPRVVRDKEPVLYYNLKTKAFYYEYRDCLLLRNEEIEKCKYEISLMQDIINRVLFNLSNNIELDYFSYLYFCWKNGTVSPYQLGLAVKKGYITEEEKIKLLDVSYIAN